MAGDRRELASRARAIAILTVERHRLAEEIDAELASIEVCELMHVPAVQIAAGRRRLALLRDELAEITPSRRQPATTEEKDPDRD